METATLDEKCTGSYTIEEIEYYFNKAVLNVTYIIYRQEDMEMKKKRVAFCIQYFTALRDVSDLQRSLAIDALLVNLKKIDDGKDVSTETVLKVLSAVVNQQLGKK